MPADVALQRRIGRELGDGCARRGAGAARRLARSLGDGRHARSRADDAPSQPAAAAAADSSAAIAMSVRAVHSA